MDKLLTVKEVAEKVNVRGYTVRKWLRDGDLVGIKLDKSWRIEMDDLQQFLEERKVG